MKFWDDVGNPSKFSIPFRDCLYHVPRQRYWPLKVAIELWSRRKWVVFGPQFFWGPIPKKSRSVLLPTDTQHALKFRKDQFRGVGGIDSKKATFAKQMLSPYMWQPKRQLYNHHLCAWHVNMWLTTLCEELRRVFAHQSNGSRYWTQKFNDVCQMVFVTWVIFTGMRLEQIVACRQLKCLCTHDVETYSMWPLPIICYCSLAC